MKTTITILLVLLLSGSVAYSQSARAELKADAIIQALALADAELEALLKDLADDYALRLLAAKRVLVRTQAQKLLDADAALRARFVSERKAER